MNERTMNRWFFEDQNSGGECGSRDFIGDLAEQSWNGQVIRRFWFCGGFSVFFSIIFSVVFSNCY